MGKPTGFLEFSRELPKDRSPLGRVADWKEFHEHMPEAELKKHGKNYEFHRYDGAGHGFFYYDRPMYRVEQALDGWKKCFEFFGKHLKK